MAHGRFSTKEATRCSTAHDEPADDHAMTSQRRLTFDGFDLLPESGELFRGGERVAIQHQPAQLLAFLIDHAGEAVTREEIRDEIWGRDSYVDHDQSINYCIRQIRQALGDDPHEPRFVETVPRHGYRFIGRAVEEPGEAPPDAVPAVASPDSPAEVVPESPPAAIRGRRRRAVALAMVAVGVLIAAALWSAWSAGRGEGEVAGGGAAEERAGRAAQPPGQLVVPEDAHFRFLKARYLLDRAASAEHVDASTEAIELLEAVVAEIPRHAEAHAVLADAWLLRFDLPRREAMERAEASARRALALDPDLPLAHTVLAATRLFQHLDWQGAEEHLARALERAPDEPDAVFLSAILASTLGRHEQAIAAARRAATLEPGELPGLSIAWFYFFAGRFDAAVVAAERVLELDPTDEPSHDVLVLSHLARGDESAADAEIDRYFRIRRGLPPGVPSGMPGARELYRQWWERRDRETPGTVSPMVHATHATFAGESESAIDHLLEACREDTAAWDLPFVAVDPRWDPLRDRERFAEVLACVGVPGTEGRRLEGLEG